MLTNQAKDEQEDTFILSCDIEVVENGIQITYHIQKIDGTIQEDFPNLWKRIKGRSLIAFIVGRKGEKSVRAHKSFLAAKTKFFGNEVCDMHKHVTRENIKSKRG